MYLIFLYFTETTTVVEPTTVSTTDTIIVRDTVTSTKEIETITETATTANIYGLSVIVMFSFSLIYFRRKSKGKK